MRRANAICLLLAIAALARGAAGAQRVVDRIVARVEDDVILQSEARELGLYQQLVNGKADALDTLLGELIEQWIAKTEAKAAEFPRPSDEDVERALADLEKQYASQDAFQKRLRELGLSAAAVKRLLGEQLYVGRYLEYKFRPSVQVEDEAIEKYYREELVPAVQARGGQAPVLDAVREEIREVLVERAISQRADKWIEETRSRLRVEILHPMGEAARKTGEK